MPMYNAIINNLTSILSNTPHVYTTIQHATTPLDTHVQDTIREHSAIGWQHFLKGHISNLWSKTQALYYSQRTAIDKHKYTILCWQK